MHHLNDVVEAVHKVLIVLHGAISSAVIGMFVHSPAHHHASTRIIEFRYFGATGNDKILTLCLSSAADETWTLPHYGFYGRPSPPLGSLHLV